MTRIFLVYPEYKSYVTCMYITCQKRKYDFAAAKEIVQSVVAKSTVKNVTECLKIKFETIDNHFNCHDSSYVYISFFFFFLSKRTHFPYLNRDFLPYTYIHTYVSLRCT